MKTIDTKPCNRAIVLEPNETLDCTQMVDALVASEFYTRVKAEAAVSLLFDALEGHRPEGLRRRKH